MNLEQVRQNITDVLETTDANVYWYVPEVVMPPAIVLVPADPYLEIMTPNRFWAGFVVSFVVGIQDNQAALNNLEALIQNALEVIPSGWQIGTVSRPQILNLGQAELLSADLEIKVIAT